MKVKARSVERITLYITGLWRIAVKAHLIKNSSIGIQHSFYICHNGKQTTVVAVAVTLFRLATAG